MLPKYLGGGYCAYWGIIDIKDNVFIGSNTTILANVKIGSNVVIAAGSLVNKDIPNDVVVAGVPARVIGNIRNLAEVRKQYRELLIDQMELKERVEKLFDMKK